MSPSCAHSLFQQGCRSCAEWATGDGVAFARQQAAARRDAHTEQLIADARSNVETPLEGPFDDKPAPPVDLVINLEGPSATAYSEFVVAAKALAEHQREGGAVLERYKAALQRLSEVAAKGGG